MTAVRIHIDGQQAIRDRLTQLGEQVAPRVIAAAAEDVEDYVHLEAGKHSKGGALFRSVYKARIPSGWEVGHDLQVAPHAVFVHWGTRPHKIRAKGRASGGKDLLRFVIGSRFVSKREINHPGYAGDPWLTRAARLAPTFFERHLNAQLERINRG